MPLSSLIIEGLVQHLQDPDSKEVEFPRFPAKSDPPGGIPPLDRILLEKWLGLPIDRRAPKRSVAMVDVRNGRYTAVVIDTVADLPLFWIEEPLASIARLYEGMGGAVGEPLDRGTVVLAAIPSRPVPGMRNVVDLPVEE
jgi:hypothetical protein